MKTRWIPLAAAVSIVLSACSKGGEQGATSEAWIQIEVAARQAPDQPAAAPKKTERTVLCAFAAPIPVDGKPGRASCVKEGVRLNVAWKAAERPPNSQDGVQLDGFQWDIANKVFPAGATAPVLLAAPSKNLILRGDFVFLLEPVLTQSTEGGAKTEISVRGRCLDAPPELKDIRFGEQPPPQEDAARRRPQVGPF